MWCLVTGTVHCYCETLSRWLVWIVLHDTISVYIYIPCTTSNCYIPPKNPHSSALSTWKCHTSSQLATLLQYMSRKTMFQVDEQTCLPNEITNEVSRGLEVHWSGDCVYVHACLLMFFGSMCVSTVCYLEASACNVRTLKLTRVRTS